MKKKKRTKTKIELSVSYDIDNDINAIVAKLAAIPDKVVSRSQVVALSILFLSELDSEFVNTLFKKYSWLAKIVKGDNTLQNNKFYVETSILELLAYLVGNIEVEYKLKRSGVVRVAIKVLNGLDTETIHAHYVRNEHLINQPKSYIT